MKRLASYILGFLIAILPAAVAQAMSARSGCDEALEKSTEDTSRKTSKKRSENNDLDFSELVQPKFTLEFLKAHRHELTAKNPKYVLGESGAAIWYVENRVIAPSTEPRIVAVKYFKNDDGDVELRQTVDSLVRQHQVFSELGLLDDFDVMLPLAMGPGYLVLDLVIGESLHNITYKRLERLNPPAKYSNTAVHELGPPTEEQDLRLAKLWEKEQKSIRRVVSALRKAGVKVKDLRKVRSWSGVQYISDMYVSYGDDLASLRLNFPIRNDLIVTTDGRFVIVDPY